VCTPAVAIPHASEPADGFEPTASCLQSLWL
jgi:hypothetical protein